MALSSWFFILVPLFALAQSRSTNQINQTDLQAAMGDMRAKSYHGFVILLKLLNATPHSLNDTDLTFLMPTDDKLSDPALKLRPQDLQDFIFSHTISTPLVFNNFLNFPNGTQVPSSTQSKMISITNGGESAMFVNNAQIVTTNVCRSSVIKCHGISSPITFDNDFKPPAHMPHVHL